MRWAGTARDFMLELVLQVLRRGLAEPFTRMQVEALLAPNVFKRPQAVLSLHLAGLDSGAILSREQNLPTAFPLYRPPDLSATSVLEATSGSYILS